MRSYLFTSPYHEAKVVFALSTVMAAEFMAVWRVLNGIEVPEYTMDSHWSRNVEGKERQHLNQALRSGFAGIGRYDPERGWSIHLPRDERQDD